MKLLNLMEVKVNNSESKLKVDPEEIILRLKKLILYFENKKPNHDEEKFPDSSAS